MPVDRADRRRTTILFADVVGYSTIAERLDPEDLQELITGTFAGLVAEVQRREGVVEKFIGDAVMVTFGASPAHEDDPERAVTTALSMLDIVRRRSAETGVNLELRIGINSGVIVAGPIGDGTQIGVVGDAVNVAARLQQAAGPGEVVISEAVWRRVRDRFEAQPLGDLTVKGRVDVVGAHLITGPAVERHRRLTPFVGRAADLDRLESAWRRTLAGHAAIVAVVGEAGVGKSRLLAEFPVRVDALDVRIHCDGEEAFGPIVELVARVLGRRPQTLAQLRDRVKPFGVGPEVVEPIGSFLNVQDAEAASEADADGRRRNLFAAILGLLRGAARDRPLLITFNDVHAADRSTIELLRDLITVALPASTMLVLTSRPDPRLDLPRDAAVETMVLEPLPVADGDRLAAAFLEIPVIPARLANLVRTRADGNPFFVEELLRSLIESGSLQKTGESIDLAGNVEDVPETVEATILTRIDRLTDDELTLLRYAAVLGPRCPTAWLLAVVSSASEDSFVRLSTTDLLRPAGHDRHHFAHALIQEVVYGTILRRRRGEMHREVAEAIERVEGLDPDTVEIIAEHHAKSDHPETAPHYLELAGDLAERRSGFAVARDRYERALRLSADDVGAPRLRLLQKLAGVTLMTEHAAALAVIDEAIRLARKSGDRSSEAWGLAMQGRALTLAGDTARAVDALESAIQQLEGVGSREKVVQSLIWLLAPLQMSGRVADGKDVVRRGLELADRLGSQAARSHLLNSLGVLQSLSADPGGPDQIREALAIAEDVGDPDSFGRASMNLCVTISWFDPPRGLPLCRPATERLRELGMSGFASYIAAAEGYMLMALGRFDEAIDACNALLTSSRRAVIAHGVAFAGMALTHAYTRTGRYEDAREAVDACLPVAIGMGVALSVPVLVARAEMSVALGHSHDARASIEQALDVALASEARSHHLWVLAPAARLLGPDPRIIGMLEEPSSHAGGKWATARIMETEALLEGDPAKAAQAADRYADLRFPFEEATCRLMEGQPGRARELIDRHGLSQAALEAVAFSTVAKDNLDSRQ